MPDALDTVKALAVELRRLATTRASDDPARAQVHESRAIAMESVAEELEASRKRLRPVSNDFGDLSDLPEEVMAQLNLSKVDELEQQMRDIIAAAEGSEVGLDQIIIELYRRHEVVQERRFVMNKLYRMGQKGLIESVEGRKGVYVLPKAWTKPASSNYDDLDAEIPF